MFVKTQGAFFDHYLGNTSGSIRDMFNKAFNINTAGAHVVTYTFVLPLPRSPTTPGLLFITLGMSTLEGAFIKQVVDGERDADADAGKAITRSGLQPW